MVGLCWCAIIHQWLVYQKMCSKNSWLGSHISNHQVALTTPNPPYPPITLLVIYYIPKKSTSTYGWFNHACTVTPLLHMWLVIKICPTQKSYNVNPGLINLLYFFLGGSIELSNKNTIWRLPLFNRLKSDMFNQTVILS